MSTVPKLAIVVLAIIGKSAGDNPYCQLSPQHTMCKFSGVGPACGEPLARGLSESEIAEVVDHHNRLRSRVASGSTDQPPAANMRVLQWDPELAAVAQRLADQCKFNHDCGDCRQVDRFFVGQNLYQRHTTSSEGKSNWVKAIDSWYSEIKDFNKDSVSRFTFSHATGHYSQMMWATTDRIGCGLTAFRSGRFTARLYVCNYGEAGNFKGQPVYKIGRGCSDCGAGGSCSAEYPGLCEVNGSGSGSAPAQATGGNNNCNSLVCMINKPILMANEAAMKTAHTMGGMAVGTVQNVGDVAMNTVHTFGDVAMNTVEGVTSLGTNIVLRPVNTLMTTGFNLIPFSGFRFGTPVRNNNNNFNNGQIGTSSSSSQPFTVPFGGLLGRRGNRGLFPNIMSFPRRSSLQ